MSAQNFLTNQLGRIEKGLKRVVAGDDYLLDSKSTPGKNYDKFKKDQLKRQVKTPNGLSSLNTPGERVPRQTRFTPEIPKPLNTNASARSRARTPVIKPNQFAAQPTGRLTAGPMPTARGGILTGLAGIAANQLVEPIAREAVTGARVLFNDPYAHTPVNIKSLNGANYDISTEAGRSGYDKAKNSGGLSDMDQRTLRLKNDERIAKIKAESDAVIKAGKDDINSDFYKAPVITEEVLSTPSRDNPPPNGGTGSGTQTSPGRPITMSMKDADALYSGGRVNLGSYSSGGKGYTSTDSSDSVYANPNITEIKPSNPLYAKAFGQDLADSQLKGNTSGMSMSEALADTESMRGPETDEGRLMRARAAFLNAEGSMQGLRAQERELDIIYAGGQHYVADGNGAFIKNSAGLNEAADPEQVRQLKSGRLSGELFKDAFKQNLINSAANKPSQGENPHTQLPVPVSFNTEPLADFGSTAILGNNMDMIAGNAFNKSDISALNDGAFTQDLDVSQYVPGLKREPYMRQ